VREPESFDRSDLLEGGNTTVHSVREAVAGSEVIVVATPPEAAEGLAATLGDLTGKTLIDTSNAVRSRPEHYPTAYHAFAALTAAQVVKCFNSTGFENMADPRYGDSGLDMFMAGDSAPAKAVAERLARDLGFTACYDFGGADRVELLEQFALSWINLAIFQGVGRGIGFKVLRR
jgi:predicted dinucleotide-binding enzyme